MVEIVARKDENDENICESNETSEQGENCEIGDLQVEAERREDRRNCPVGRIVIGPGETERTRRTGWKRARNFILTPAGKVTSLLVALFLLKVTERSEDKSAKRSFASKYLEILFLTRSFALRF